MTVRIRLYTPVLTENGSICSDFTAGCLFMLILKKLKSIRIDQTRITIMTQNQSEHSYHQL